MRRRRPGVLRRPVWPVCTAAGVLACALTAALPRHLEDFGLGAGPRAAMATAGAALLLVVGCVPRGRTRGTVPAVGVLGASVLAYPSVLALSAAGAGGPVLAVLAGGWHAVPLTLVQLAPVLASTRILGRRRRWWEAAVLAAAVVSSALVVTGVQLAAAEALFLASFLLAPIATWTAVRGTGGETRRRSVLAAVASMAPVAVIVWCTTLGFLAAGVGAGEDLSVAALLCGFALGTLLCGLAVVATTAPAGSAVLRTRVVVGALHGLLAGLVLIAGSVVALLLPADDVPPGWALLAGAAAAAALTWPWLRLHSWVVRVVDPAAELRHELSTVGDAGDGQQRRAVLLVLRRLLEDPALTVHFRVETTTWAQADGTAGPEPTGAVSLAAGPAGPTALARASTPEAAARIAALGDCTAALRPALLEARAAHEAGRAAAAAEDERRRIAADLHDGLQGRLLGLALNLQLSGRDVEDPAARLLLEETVEGLRSTVSDVRALGGGRQPEILARDGLAPALASLLAHLRPVVELDVPATRFAQDVEATAYFVVGEAVTNAVKHAGARRVAVRVGATGAALTVTVTDDGRGGADPRAGSGLRGLAERVAAAGGVLVVRDGCAEGPDRGTVVEAVVPCGS